MRSLCDAMLGKVETRHDDLDDFNMEQVLETQAEEQLEEDAVAEIDRYRRMDEWSSSYQNVYSRAALRCQMQLTKANILGFDCMQFLPYTRAGTYDLLRLDAFECLVEMDLFGFPELMKWFVFAMSSDSSAGFRNRLHDLFGKTLAPIAFGRGPVNGSSAQNDGLIIEQESSTEVRQADLARRQTVPGAMEALRKEISGDQVLKESLWAACNSPCIGLLELSELTDLCRVLYDPITSVKVTLKYPRYWKVQHLGKVSQGFKPKATCRILTYSSRVACISTNPIMYGLPSPRTLRLLRQSANVTTKACHHQALALLSNNQSPIPAPRHQPLVHSPFRNYIFRISWLRPRLNPRHPGLHLRQLLPEVG